MEATVAEVERGESAATKDDRQGLAAWATGLPVDRLGEAAGKGFLALTDEGLVSASNFVLSLLLARWLVPTDYGLFALLYYGVAAGLVTLYGSVLLQPMSVLGPANYKDRLSTYVRLLAYWQRLALVALFIGVLAVGLVWGLGGDSRIAGGILGLAVALTGLIYMQYARQLCYLWRRPSGAVWGGLVYVALLVCGLGWLLQTQALGVGATLLTVGLAGFGSGFAQKLYLRRFLRAREPGLVYREHSRILLREAWSFGRWTGGASLAGWAAGSLPYFLSSSFLGLAGAGAFQAALNLVKPVQHLASPFGRLVVPAWSEGWTAGRGGTVPAQAVRWALILGGTALVYASAALLAGPLVFREVYEGRYSFDPLLTGGLLLASVLVISMTILVMALQAMQRPQAGTWVQMVALLAGLLLGPPAIGLWGISGVGLAVLVQAAAGLLAVVLVFRLSGPILGWRPEGGGSRL